MGRGKGWTADERDWFAEQLLKGQTAYQIAAKRGWPYSTCKAMKKRIACPFVPHVDGVAAGCKKVTPEIVAQVKAYMAEHVTCSVRSVRMHLQKSGSKLSVGSVHRLMGKTKVQKLSDKTTTVRKARAKRTRARLCMFDFAAWSSVVSRMGPTSDLMELRGEIMQAFESQD